MPTTENVSAHYFTSSVILHCFAPLNPHSNTVQMHVAYHAADIIHTTKAGHAEAHLSYRLGSRAVLRAAAARQRDGLERVGQLCEQRLHWRREANGPGVDAARLRVADALQRLVDRCVLLRVCQVSNKSPNHVPTPFIMQTPLESSL